MRRKNKECILVILLQSIYTPVVNIHAFTQLSHFCNSIDTIEPLLKKGFVCSCLSVLYWSLKQILYSSKDSNKAAPPKG